MHRHQSRPRADPDLRPLVGHLPVDVTLPTVRSHRRRFPDGGGDGGDGVGFSARRYTWLSLPQHVAASSDAPERTHVTSRGGAAMASPV